MQTARFALPLVLILLTAGCLGSTGEQAGPTAVNETDGTDGSPTGDSPNGTSAPEEASTPSLASAPDWEVGEWWRIELSSTLLDEPATFTRVVAGVEGEDHLVGQPRDDWETKALVFHVPGLGEVRQDDLSYEVHDVRFHALQFPLTDGAEWSTSFEGLDVDASAQVNDDGTVSLHYCCGRNITATYDPSVGAITEFDADDGFMHYEVVDHGYGFEGVVTVPHGHDLVFNHGRVAGALDTSLNPAPPVEEVELSSDYQRVSFVQIAGPIGLAPLPASSAYVERAHGPDGSTYETQHIPTDGGELTVSFHETTELGGTWSFEHAAPGPGLAFTEGIAYHVFDMQVPQGQLLGDHSEHMTP